MPLDPSFVNVPKKFTFFNLGVYLGSGEDGEERKVQNTKALEFFQFYGLVPTFNTVTQCPECSSIFGKEREKGKGFLGFRYICKNIFCQRYDKRVSLCKMYKSRTFTFHLFKRNST